MSLIISLDEYKTVDIVHPESGCRATVQVRDVYEVGYDKYGRVNYILNHDENPRRLRGAHLYFDDPARNFRFSRAGYQGPSPPAMPKAVAEGLSRLRGLIECGEAGAALALIDEMMKK